MNKSGNGASIGFIIFYPFQYFVYKNIYKHLAEDAEFIIDMGAHFPVEQPPELLGNIIALLEKDNVRFRVLNYRDYFDIDYVRDFFSVSKVLVSLWERGSLVLECNEDKKKISMAYGAGKELTMVRPSRRVYDLILAYGPNDSRLFSIFAKSIEVGVPKFDDWFNQTLDQEFLNEIKKGLDPKKRTILYLPTHGDLSSIDLLAENLKELSNNYNLLIKLHYFNKYEEGERAEMISGTDIRVFDDSSDLLPLLKIADAVISDNSSAIFDAILADKPVLAADFVSDEYLDYTHKKMRVYRRGFGRALTYSKSIEQTIKREKLVETIKSPDELKEGLVRTLADDVFYKNARADLRKKLFAYTDGKSGQRAAAAIREVQSWRSKPEKPIMAHAMNNYIMRYIQARVMLKRKTVEIKKQMSFPYYFPLLVYLNVMLLFLDIVESLMGTQLRLLDTSDNKRIKDE